MLHLLRGLAVAFAVVAHGFLLALSSPPSPIHAVGYVLSAACMAGAAWLLWRRTMDADG